MSYQIIKTFGNDRGFSCCFRQWRATHSHCSLLHGYAIGVRFTVSALTLDDRNWVFDFGQFKEIKKLLEDIFDHTCIVASDDPYRSKFEELRNLGLLKLVEMPDVGCEKFAEHVYVMTKDIIEFRQYVKLESVEVFEHESNSAVYLPNPPGKMMSHSDLIGGEKRYGY